MALMTEPVYTLNKNPERITEFGGLNLRGVRTDNEMSDMLHLCSDEYPMLATARGAGASTVIPRAAHIHQMMDVSYQNSQGELVTSLYALAEADDGSLDVLKDGTVLVNVPAGNKMVRINKKICFFPAKQWIEIGNDNPALIQLDGWLHKEGTIKLYKDHITCESGITTSFGSDLSVGDAVNLGAGVSNLAKTKLACLNGSKPTSGDRFWLNSVGADGVDNSSFVEGDTNIFTQNVNFAAKIKYTTASKGVALISPTTLKLNGISGKKVKVSSVTVKSEGEIVDVSSGRFRYVIAVKEWSVDDDGKITVTFASDILVSSGSGTGTWTMDQDCTIQIQFTATSLTVLDAYDIALEIRETAGVISKITDDSIYFEKDMWLLPDEYGVEYLESSHMAVRMEREVPDLDYVIEWNNRLWGCNSASNTIYASKLGDPTNWNYFQATALDSYAAEQGSNGVWTGVGKYSTHLLFFKEDCIHKVYGNFPSEFQIVTQMCSGVSQGSHDSVVTLEDGVLYLSRRGVMAYSGGIPVLISSNFGRHKYANAVAGYDGDLYWISMDALDENGQPSGEAVTMTYDVELQMWHKYDTLKYTAFCRYLNQFCFARDWRTGYSGRMAGCLNQPRTTDNGEAWMAAFGPFDEWHEGQKIYSVISIRYEMMPGTEQYPSTLAVFIKPDNLDAEQVEFIEGKDMDSTEGQEIHLIPRRCDHFSLKLIGRGHCKIKSITREFRLGTANKENY